MKPVHVQIVTPLKKRTVAPVAPPPEPSLFNKAKNIATAGVQVVAAAATGKPVLVPDEIKAERLDACVNRCPGKHWIPEGNFGLGKCRLCGCSKLKHEFAALECPLKVWLKYIPQT